MKMNISYKSNPDYHRITPENDKVRYRMGCETDVAYLTFSYVTKFHKELPQFGNIQYSKLHRVLQSSF